MKIANRWKNLPLRGRVTIIAAAVVFASLIVFAIIWRNDQPAPFTPNPDAFQTGTDPTSGQTTNTGQGTPELSDVSGAAVIYGLSALLDRGMLFDDVQTVRSILTAWFRDINDNPHAANQISLSPDLTHTIDNENGTNTYTTTLVADNNRSYQLTITTDINGVNLVTLADPDSADPVTIFGLFTSD